MKTTFATMLQPAQSKGHNMSIWTRIVCHSGNVGMNF
jgi:hypothetical protein